MGFAELNPSYDLCVSFDRLASQSATRSRRKALRFSALRPLCPQSADCQAAVFQPNCRARATGFVRAITLGDFYIMNAGLAQSFLLDRISGGRRTLIVPAALIFDSDNRPATLIDNKDVDSLTVDRAKRIFARRRETSPRLVCAKTR